jgi:hypothetical protein
MSLARHFAPVALRLPGVLRRLVVPALAGVAMALLTIACFIDPNPPHPHDAGIEALTASDASIDAPEEP